MANNSQGDDPGNTALINNGSVYYHHHFIGYSAMAGVCGGGGLGDLAIRYGYYRYEDDVMILTIILLVIIVQIIQSIGDYLSKRIDKKNK